MPLPDCLCGHSKLSHDVEAAPVCVREDCGCKSYRPRLTTSAGPRPVHAVPPPQPSLSQGGAAPLVAQGLGSEDKRTVALARRVDDLLTQLTARLRDELEKKQALVEVARLEAELRTARALLHPELVCDIEGCGRVFDAAQGLAVHRARGHNLPKPKAAEAV